MADTSVLLKYANVSQHSSGHNVCASLRISNKTSFDPLKNENKKGLEAVMGLFPGDSLSAVQKKLHQQYLFIQLNQH